MPILDYIVYDEGLRHLYSAEAFAKQVKNSERNTLCVISVKVRLLAGCRYLNQLWVLNI